MTFMTNDHVTSPEYFKCIKNLSYPRLCFLKVTILVDKVPDQINPNPSKKASNQVSGLFSLALAGRLVGAIHNGRPHKGLRG